MINQNISKMKSILKNYIMEDILLGDRSFEINDDTLAVDLIKEVGPGGEFLSTEHTIKYCRKEPFKPEVSHRGVLKNFKDTNDANISNVKKKLDKMLNNYEKPDISLDIKIKLLNYLKSIGADVKQMM
ncbi:MAG: trimethylamine methyltransferase family protein [Clostridia bacterium]|nr:trimethylamine methyltransferase family protein [Clostridia bacterium]